MVSKSKIELCHTVPEENVIDFFSIGALSGGGLQASISGTWLLMAFWLSTLPLGQGHYFPGTKGLVLASLGIIWTLLRQPFPNLSESRSETDRLKASAFADCTTGMMITDQGDRILYTNAPFQHLTGLTEQERLGRWPCDLFDPLEQDLPRSKAVFPYTSQRLPFSEEI